MQEFQLQEFQLKQLTVVLLLTIILTAPGCTASASDEPEFADGEATALVKRQIQDRLSNTLALIGQGTLATLLVSFLDFSEFCTDVISGHEGTLDEAYIGSGVWQVNASGFDQSRLNDLSSEGWPVNKLLTWRVYEHTETVEDIVTLRRSSGLVALFIPC